jgi:hypothetical protein
MSIFGSRVLTTGILAAIGLVTVRMLMAFFGIVMSFVSFMFFTVLPLAIGAWLVYKLFKYMTRERPPAATTSTYQ